MKKLLLAALVALGLVTGCGKNDSYFRNRTVMLKGERNLCSGEQVRAPSGQDYILSAGHCTVTAKDGTVQVITEDGRTLQRRVIEEDPKSDLLLIEGLPDLKGLDIGYFEQKGQTVRTFTHGAGLSTYETWGVLIEEREIKVGLFPIEQESDKDKCDLPKYKIIDIDVLFGTAQVCIMQVKEWGTTALIVPGSSGGMVVNSQDELIGVVSAGDGTFGWLVPLSEIRALLHSY